MSCDFFNESSLVEYKQSNTYARVVLKTTNNLAKDYWVEIKYVLRVLSRIVYLCFGVLIYIGYMTAKL